MFQEIKIYKNLEITLSLPGAAAPPTPILNIVHYYVDLL